MELTVHFNRIYVIQSLPDDEYQTGTFLHDDIIKRRTYHFEHLTSELINVESKEELFGLLMHLTDLFYLKQVVPYLHFEIHGCTSGLVMKNGELVKWEELKPYLSAINKNIENNLFVSLATCYGAYILSAIDLMERIPFVAFIGPVNEVKTFEVEIDWTTYFDILLTEKEFFLAIKALNESNVRVPYAFYTAEDIFDRYSKAYIAMFSSRKDRREKMRSLAKRAKKLPGIKESYSITQLKDYFKFYVSNQPKFMAQIKDYFLFRSDKLPFH